MKRYFFLALLLIASPASAQWQEARTSQGVAGVVTAAGCTTYTIGNSTITTGDSSVSQDNDIVLCTGPITTSGSGTATLTKYYILSTNSVAGQDIKVGLYNSDGSWPTTIVGSETEFLNVGTWTGEWKEFDVSIQITLGNSYHFCYQLSTVTSFTVYYTAQANKRQWDNLTYGTAWNATYDQNSSGGANYAVKATYCQ